MAARNSLDKVSERLEQTLAVYQKLFEISRFFLWEANFEYYEMFG